MIIELKSPQENGYPTSIQVYTLFQVPAFRSKVFILFEWFNYEYGLPYNTVTLSNLCSQSNLVKQRSRISSTNNSIKMLIDFDIYELVPVP